MRHLITRLAVDIGAQKAGNCKMGSDNMIAKDATCSDEDLLDNTVIRWDTLIPAHSYSVLYFGAVHIFLIYIVFVCSQPSH